MLIDVSKSILDLEGRPVKNSEKDDDFLTLKQALLLALSRGDKQGSGLTVSETIKRTDLAQKIQKAEGELELKAEDIAKLKELLAGLIQTIGFNPIVSGLVMKILDPAEAAS